jgi:hypothetical protein
MEAIMKHGKMMSFTLLGGLLFGLGVAVNPASAQTTVACPPGYYYLPGTGCQLFGDPATAYAYSYPDPYVYPPTFYAPFGGFHGGDHDFHGHEGFHGGGEHGRR